MLIVNIGDPKRFNIKTKPVIYTRTFVQLYNKENYQQIYKLYIKIEFEKVTL